MTESWEQAALQLAEQGWTLLTDFLPDAAVMALAAEAQQLYAGEQFREANVGRGTGQEVQESIRRDRILWLNPHALTPAQARYWEAMEAMRLTLNRTLFLSLVGFEAHYAVYEPGAFYKRHVDRFRNADERVVSSTLYLNPDWNDQDGGELRLYAEGSSEEEAVATVPPHAGTFVLFRSDTVPHEVLPASRTRYSLTAWFRRRSLLPF